VAFGRKKSPVKIGPQMTINRTFKVLNIKYSHRYPKRHFIIRNYVFWRISRKNPFRV